jgi:hypothetical protein
MRMLNYFVNRAGSGLRVLRPAELEMVKSLFSKRIIKRRAQRESS